MAEKIKARWLVGPKKGKEALFTQSQFKLLRILKKVEAVVDIGETKPVGLPKAPELPKVGSPNLTSNKIPSEPVVLDEPVVAPVVTPPLPPVPTPQAPVLPDPVPAAPAIPTPSNSVKNPQPELPKPTPRTTLSRNNSKDTNANNAKK